MNIRFLNKPDALINDRESLFFIENRYDLNTKINVHRIVLIIVLAHGSINANGGKAINHINGLIHGKR